MEAQKKLILFLKKCLWYLSISAVMFCKQCLSYIVHIDWCNNPIRKVMEIHVGLNIYLW